MSSNPTCLVQAKNVLAAETTQYTAPASCKYVLIEKVSTYSAAGGTLTLSIIEDGESAAAKSVVYAKSYGAGDAYGFPEAVGHVLMPGDFISTASGADDTVNIRITGRVVY
jgi:hypothetical protein